MRRLEEYITVGAKRMRCGYTTGTCAAAASRAAAELLLCGRVVPAVTVSTPAGVDVVVEVEEHEAGDGWAECAVRKDAGDDPDVTDGALVFARVEFSDEPGIRIEGGLGVGRVTREGLDQPVGAAAINSTPRHMIMEQIEGALEAVRVGADAGGGTPVLKQSCFVEQPTGLFESCGTARGHAPASIGSDASGSKAESAGGGESLRNCAWRPPAPSSSGASGSKAESAGGGEGLLVTVSIPAGVELAAKTFNPRLGIEGGISVLGTSGIVRPMSEDALIASIELELKALRARGVEDVLVVPGNYGRDFACGQLNLNMDAAVSCSNYFGATIDAASLLGFRRMLIVGHIGKMAKVAGGIMNTHSRVADCRVEVLAAHAALAGAPQGAVCDIMDAATTDAALDVLGECGLADEAMASLMASLADKLGRRATGGLRIEAIVFSNAHGVLGMTPGAEALAGFWR